MRAALRKAAAPVLLLALLVLAVTFQNDVVSQAKRDLPAAMEFRAGSGLRLSFDQVESAPIAKAAPEFAASALQSGTAAPALAPEATTPVDLLLTTSAYGGVAALHLVRGAYFQVSPVPEESRFAVVSDRLAVRLFLTENAVGRVFLLGGERFTVCGVYRAPSSLMERLSSDGGDAVYIPYTALPVFASAKPTALFVSGADTISMQAVEGQIVNTFGGQAGASSYTNFLDTRALLREGQKVRLFLFGLPVLILLAVLLSRRSGACAAALGRGDARAARRNAVYAAGCLAALLALFFFVRFQPYLPGGFLPTDNIFDFGFYQNAVVSAVQAKNAYGGCDFFWNLSARALCWGAAGLIVSLALYGMLFAALLRRGQALSGLAEWIRIRGGAKLPRKD